MEAYLPTFAEGYFAPGYWVPVWEYEVPIATRACLTIQDQARYAVTTQGAPRYTVTISDEAC